MNRVVLAGLAVLLTISGTLTVVLAIMWQRQAREEAIISSLVGQAATDTDLVQPREDILTQYTLTERSGRPFRSQDLKGQVQVTSFFFANCPSTCRVQNQKIQELHNEFGPQGVKFISITCDPESDTPARLSEYASLFNAHPENWLFLTGDLQYIRRVAGEIYTVPLDKYVHSERLVVTDRAGRIHGNYLWNKPDDIVQLKAALKKLLAQTPAEAEASETPADDSISAPNSDEQAAVSRAGELPPERATAP